MSQMGAELAPDGLEADDSLGINQTDDTIICSLDKDLLMIPGKHFQWAISGKNWEKPDTFIDQTYADGMKLFYEQCIKGDTSDNIKGIPGMGEAKARKALASIHDELGMFKRVRDMYGNDEEFLMNARVLWIKRTLEDDFGDRFDALVQE
jgi:5'-3' exonuclease